MRPENLVYMQNGALKKNDEWNTMSVIFPKGIRCIKKVMKAIVFRNLKPRYHCK